MGGSKTGFFVLDIILLAVFVNLILMVFNLTRIKFAVALFLMIILFFIAFIALTGVYNNQNWGFVLMSASFAIMLIGVLVVRYFNAPLSSRIILTTLLSALGFIMSVTGIKRKRVCRHKEAAAESREEKVYTNFEPGKYVASRTGTTYHAPKCDWAKKIREGNRVWLDSDKEAREKGYKKHSCLE